MRRLLLSALLAGGIGLAQTARPPASKPAPKPSPRAASPAPAAARAVKIRFDGVYHSRISRNNQVFYSYFRFYPDGSAIQANHYEGPEEAAARLEKGGSGTDGGRYKVSGDTIHIAIDRSYATLTWDGDVESATALRLRWKGPSTSGEEVYEFHPVAFAPVAKASAAGGAARLRKPALVQAAVGSSEVIRDEQNRARHCLLATPLAPPRRFARGTLEVAFQFDFDPQKVRATNASIVGMDFPRVAVETTCCQRFAIIMGNPMVDRVACRVARADKQAFKSGSYRLVVSGDDAAVLEAEVPFVVD
jgi:hypothetical protein